MTNRISACLMITLALGLTACDKKEAAKDTTTSTTTTTTDGGSTTTGSTSSSTTTTTESTSAPFTSAEGKFSIVMPPGFATPEESVQPMPTPKGNVDLKMYTSGSGNTAAMVAFADMADKVPVKGNEKAMLDGGRDKVLQTMNAKLEKEEEIDINGSPGRRLIFSMEPQAGTILQGRLQMYMADPMLYQVFYISDDRAKLDAPEVNNYFESFKLTGS